MLTAIPDDHVGYLVERGRGLSLQCWRCRRRSELTPEQIGAAARPGPDEAIHQFATRCRCAECGAKGARYGYEGEPRPMIGGRIITRKGSMAWDAE